MFSPACLLLLCLTCTAFIQSAPRPSNVLRMRWGRQGSLDGTAANPLLQQSASALLEAEQTPRSSLEDEQSPLGMKVHARELGGVGCAKEKQLGWAGEEGQIQQQKGRQQADGGGVDGSGAGVADGAEEDGMEAEEKAGVIRG